MLQIQADLFGHAVKIPANPEGSSIGAAILAMKSIGAINSYTDIEEYLPIVREFTPKEDRYVIYQEKFAQFKKLYSQLKPLMGAIQ